MIRLARLLVLAALVLLAACVHPTAAAVNTANAAAVGLTAAHDALAGAYRAEQVAAAEAIVGARNEPRTKEMQRVAVRLVRERYGPAWATYSGARAAWLALAAAIEIAQAGGQWDAGQLYVLALDLADAYREAVVAVEGHARVVPGAPPPGEVAP